jgi:hypothetical protein
MQGWGYVILMKMLAYPALFLPRKGLKNVGSFITG